MARRFKWIHGLASLGVAAIFMAPVQAKYVGPDASQAASSVAAILQSPVDDQHVTLQGHLLRKTGHEKYLFSDGTGEILAEIDDHRFPAEAVSDKTRVRIRAEVDTKRDRPPELEVKSLEIAP